MKKLMMTTAVAALLMGAGFASAIAADQSVAPNNDAATRSYNSDVTTNTTTGGNESIAAIDLRAVSDSERASKIIGNDVVNSNDETVGKIDDLLIKNEGGKSSLYAVVSVGGFLGIGNKDVVVPYGQLQIAKDKVMLPGVTKESLKALPDYKHSS